MIEGITIPTHWSWATFGDVARVASDLVDPTLTPDAFHIAPNHIESKTGKLLPFTTVASDKVTSPKHRFHSGQILYSKIRPYLAKAVQISFEGVCSADMYPVDALIDAKFIFHWLLSPWFTAMTSQNQGRTILPKINQVALGRLPVPVPPLCEQQRIAAKIEELFSDLDAGVAALKRARANLKRYRAAVLKAAVEGKLTEEWRAKHPAKESASTLLARILKERRQKWEADQLAKFAAAEKEPPKNWREKYVEPTPPDMTGFQGLPEGWTVASVDQLTTTITSGSRDWTQYYGSGTGTFLMAQNVRKGQLDLEYRQAVNPPPNDRDSIRSQVACNDLLVTIVGANTGDVCRVPNDLPEHYVCQSVALMRPVVADISSYVEVYFIADHGGQKHFRRYIYGQGRPHLGFDELRMTPVVLPPLLEQAQMVAEAAQRLSIVAAAETEIEQSLLRASRLRQSILKQAFEGKLVPQDPKDELASVLLNRLRARRSAHEGNGKVATSTITRNRRAKS